MSIMLEMLVTEEEYLERIFFEKAAPNLDRVPAKTPSELDQEHLHRVRERTTQEMSRKQSQRKPSAAGQRTSEMSALT